MYNIDPDPERHLKRLIKVFGVTQRIQKLAIRRKRSPTILSREAQEKEALANAKNLRASRLNCMAAEHRYIIDVVADYYNIDPNEIIEGIIDNQEYVDALSSFLAENGKNAAMFLYSEMSHPPIESGRYVHKLRDEKMFRAICTTITNSEMTGKCILVYRNTINNKLKQIDMRTIADDIFFVGADVQEGESVIAAVTRSLVSVNNPTCDNYKNYGVCNKAQKTNFMHGFVVFQRFLLNTETDVENMVVFQVNHDLYKGHLLVPYQVEETSKKQPLVAEVENSFNTWMRQMQTVITQGNQIRRDPFDVGPLHELEYWRQMLTRYTSVLEFVTSKPFLNHLSCLVFSRSKLVKLWKQVDNDLTSCLCESKSNVKYIGFLERFWDPLYRCTPAIVATCLPGLLCAVRSVYKLSNFYNHSDRVAGFLSKITNQLTLLCISFLTHKDTVSIWEQHYREILMNIEECLSMFQKYRAAYYQTMDEMREAKEKLWECSEKFIFGRMDLFIRRLNLIKIVLDTNTKYCILDRINITGTEKFSEQIKNAFRKLVAKSRSPLEPRVRSFDKDFIAWKSDVEDAELGLQKFAKQLLHGTLSTEGSLLILKRLERLQLDCLCLDRRYLDVAVMLETEIIHLKDVYNEYRNKPPITRGSPPISGRIMWVRNLFRKMNTPMEAIKLRQCVIEHKNAQLAVKYYNNMSCVFYHYEIMYHKAWYDYLEEVRTKIELPILKKNEANNWYEIQFHSSIFEAMKESECMLKLQLEIPDLGKVLVYLRENILGSLERLRSLLDRNNNLRMSIPMVLLNLCRPILSRLELAFNPALSSVMWTSAHLTDFLNEVERTLDDVERFMQTIVNIMEFRIEDAILFVKECNLIKLPTDPVTPSEFLEMNVAHRQNVEKIMEIHSLAAEKATVELINRFVELQDITDVNNVGVFQLPPDKITPENKRKQELLPIDKYDWISFEKIFRPIFVNLEEHRKILFFKDYTRVDYNLHLLHIDAMELFSFFTGEIVAALAMATKTSLEGLRTRSNLTNIKLSSFVADPIFVTSLELKAPACVINPDLVEIEKYFSSVVKNVVETHYAITTWGKQAKTLERRTRKPLIGEIRHEKSFFKEINEHKATIRIVSSFASGLSIIEPDISSFLKDVYADHCYIWAETRDKAIKTFADTNPLTADIREKFIGYDQMTEDLKEANRVRFIGPIMVGMDRAFDSFIVEAKKWKTFLGEHLSVMYKEKLEEFVTFIKDREKVLERNIKDLDDVRLAMKCLDLVRENFIGMDIDLSIMVEAYVLFNKYDIHISKDDYDKVEGLRYSFDTMIEHSKEVTARIAELEQPLMLELKEGISQFEAEIDEFNADFESRGPMIEGLPAKEASDRTFIFQNRFDEIWRKFEMYQNGQKLFGMPVTDYPILHSRKNQFNLLTKLYGLYLVVNKTIDGYFDTPWTEIDETTISEQLADFQRKCQALPKGMHNWNAFIDLKKKIDDFNAVCPLLESMTSPGMKERHWTKMEELMSFSFDVYNPKTTLGRVMEAPLLKNFDDVMDVCTGAVKEQEIEAKLKETIANWSNVNLQLAPFKTRGDLLLKGTETLEIIALIEDSLMIMNSLASNRYNIPFKKDIMLWLGKLSNTSEVLEKWMIVQNVWAYLEAVFVGGDIAKQLPAEAKRFTNIDKAYVKLMMRAREIVNVVETCTGDETMMTMLPYLIDQLEACQKSLTGYLETKRLIFPRFFFVSDPVLLEILGRASEPASIQAHLLSIFDAVATVDFEERSTDKITAINSANGEKIPLGKIVQCVGGVENWLGRLLEEMQDTIKTILATMAVSLSDPEFNFVQDFKAFCGQAGLLGVQILWTGDSEYALRKCRTDKVIMRRYNQRFLDLLNDFIELTILDLTKLDRIKFETMVTIHVHQRDIFDELCRLRIKSGTDFEWQKQARFYYVEETDDCIVKITDVDFIYQNEYLGVAERLAVTPLTDRCYITLAQAIGMSMGGAPAGPAGTGKTETTKDMARTLGKLVVVFNCSDQMDFRGLGRIYKGLAQSGSWGCFDEFNRIELPVLSVAAQQIYIVLTARKEKKPTFLFSDGDTVSLNPEFGLFITMNPGYAGRQELPENLKIQFRAVSMMVPDRQIIMRVKLASCGFKENVILARKFFTLYKLCEEQLSKQVHYDFGLRNILSVLRTLGTQKRANPTFTEENIVMRVLRDMNISKLVDEDEPLFISLIEDLFPSTKLTAASNKVIQRAIANAVEEMGLVNNPQWNLKVVQLYDTSLVRHGLMTMGPSGSGKTKCINVLLKSITAMGVPHREIRMNPKAITAPQMFGRLDAATNDWTDGIFSNLWRRTLKVKPTEFVWLILDGPVDAVWIENLNSVLDDNKTLTLANGDRIVMSPNCKLVFEPDNVDNASPATVSRVGMVFMSASVLKWEPIFEAWVKKRDTDGEAFRTHIGKIYDDAHTFVQTKLLAKMNILESFYIRQCIDLLEGLLKNTSGVLTNNHIEHLFLFSVMWSLGAVLELNDREKFQEFVVTHESKMRWPKRQPGESIFDYLVGDNGVWIHWEVRIPQFIYPDDSVPEYASILVPNVDNVRTAFLIHTIADQSKAVLLIGEQGTAKTVMVRDYTSHYDPEEHMVKRLNFSSATTPNMFQRIIESYVEKRVGLSYGPPGQRKMTVFIDDINMPIINEWGDQITNEIVRQLMEQSGFYSLERPGDFVIILQLQYIAAMIHPGGGRNDIPNRLKRQFNVFNCALPSDNSLDQIFGNIARGYFCDTRFNKEVVAAVPAMIPLTRLLWQATKVKMLPTPAKFHYVFNLRDLSRIWEGILKIENAECENVTSLMKLWRHECFRVIADRFTNFPDKIWFNERMGIIVNKSLPQYSELYTEEEVYFVDFLRDPPEVTGDEPDDFCMDAPKIYEEWPSFEYVRDFVYKSMAEFNENIRGYHLDLVLFHDALVHLIIISRIIRTPRGNALLVGVGGSGKQSLTRLASFIANYSFYQITMTRSYNVSNLMDDLKYLFRTGGLLGEGITFIFTDNDIKDEAYLEFINNVLSSGEVSNLFPKDEMDEMLNELIPIMKKADPKRPPTVDNLYDFFISRSRFNLHVALCFSPIGEKFRNRSLKFPGLISGCTIDWFQTWPVDACEAVSSYFLLNFDMVCGATVKQNVIEMMSFIHNNVNDTCEEYYDRFRRKTFVTPKSLLTFLASYKIVYNEKRREIQDMAQRMQTGLFKLVEAAASVEILKVELLAKNKEIIVAEEAAEIVLASVKVSAEAAEIVKEKVAEIKVRAEALVEQISKEKAVAEAKLEAAKPALDEAEAALKTIKGTDIATVRKLGTPPYIIKLIMDAVLILFRKPIEKVTMDTEKKFLQTANSWKDSATKVMGDIKFLSNIVNYPTDIINSEMIDLLQPYFKYSLYTFDAAKAACGNVAGLLSWTIAMSKYYDVNKDVLPLKANLAIQEAKYQAAATDLSNAEKMFADKELELAGVKAKFDEAMELKNAVLDDARKCQEKMDAATALIEGLADEKVRWTNQLSQFKKETDRLVGDIIYLTGFLSYMGPFNQEFRIKLQKTWTLEINRRNVPITNNINVIDSLTDNVTIGEWNMDGLPNDDLSVQNGIIVTKAERFPLLIDPQTQGKNWILNKERPNNLIVTSLNHKYFRNHIEDAVQMGMPILIEDVGEELDPALDNILEKNLVKVGTSFKVKIGDKEVDFNDDFRVYITTKLANPVYTPEISARTSIIDFAVTMQGLEDQLLGRVIMTEKNELEKERVNLIQNVTANRKKMKELEENLLHKLSTVEGSLLDDVSVINVLNVSKVTATEVQEKLQIAKVTEVKINTAREEFRPVATRGSVLYFLVCTMSMVNVMYQTSLAQFLERFDISMELSPKTPVNKRRIENIIKYLTYEIYRYTTRGLYEIHKYLFTMLMAFRIDIQNDRIMNSEFQTFIKGGAALDINDCMPKPHKWITDITWLNLSQLSKELPQFARICIQVTNNERGWKAWYQKQAPEEEPVPDGYNSLDAFRKMLLIRAWCPDRTLSQSRKYLIWSLGEEFAVPVVLNYEEIFEESRPLTPLVCFLSMGSDPTTNIEALAKKNETQCRSISMGQGQEIHARKLIAECLEIGGWSLLQNCHLGLEYMYELVEKIAELESNQTEISNQFRVWITTEPHDSFPITLLQQSIKFTNEPPDGVRAGLTRTYANLSQDLLDFSDSPFYLPLVYAVSFLHTVVQERRKFGPLGWNIPYEFNSSDWLASCMFMQNHLAEIDPKKGISWSTVRYMLSEVQYGGRVTDDFDKRLLNTFARSWFSDDMFSDDFVFYKGYRIMSYKNKGDYLTEIDEMPGVDPPQAYGLHSNADITYQANTTQQILDDIISVQPKESGGGGGETREQIVARMVKDMQTKLPPPYDPYELKERLREMGLFSSMVIFLRQELDRMQKILILVKETLKDLLLAIDGIIIMNEQLRNAFDNIFDARVPAVWSKISWASSSLGFWFTDLLDRNAQFNDWCFKTRPAMFWMSGFFNSQGFLTAMRQEVARAHKGWALDTVTMHNEVTRMTSDECKKPPKEGVYVHGLFLEGAGWDRKNIKLCEATPKVLFTLMPVIHIYAVNSTAPKSPKLYMCPVYKKPKRTDLNFITSLYLDTVKPTDHWVLRGVAMLCDIK